MKLVVALIRSEQLPAVKQALFDAQIKHMTATTVLGTASRTEQQMYRGMRRDITLFNRVEVKVAVNDANLETVMEAIAAGAMESGGYGKIFVTELAEVMTVWTGERGPRALQQ